MSVSLERIGTHINFCTGPIPPQIQKEAQLLERIGAYTGTHRNALGRPPEDTVAIMSANLELIDRLSTRQERTENEQAAFVRHYRALDDIQLLMETLLWVNRQSDNLLKSEQIDLRLELDSVVENCSYLLDERDVSLTVTGSGEATAPAVAVHIVLSNLVRNAFQYTMDGEVLITITYQLFHP